MCMHSSMLYRENNMSAKCVLLLLCYHQLLGGAVSEFTPTVYGIKSTAECGQYNPLHDEQLNQVLRQVQQRLPTRNLSCKSILNRFPLAPSGHYNITTTNSTTIMHWSTVTWRGPTVEEREAGRELHTST